MVHYRASLRTTAFALAALACGACTSPKTSTNTPPIVKGSQPVGLAVTAPWTGGTIALDADNGLALPVGLTKQLTATETFADGTSQDVTAATQWKSSSAVTGRVTSAGLVSAVAIGNATVTATMGALSLTFPLAVEPAIVSIAIATDLSALWVGGTQAIQVIATLTDGTTLDVSGQATWSSGTTSIATISPSGVVTGVAVGMSTITATVDSFSATAAATVLPTQPVLMSIAIGTDNSPPSALASSLLPGLAQVLGVWGTYTETDAIENVTSSAVWMWSSSNTGAATISTGGIVTAVAAGTTMISVSGLGQTASVSITVTAPVQSIAIAGLPVSLGAGTYMFPDVLATLTDGSSLDVYPWATLASSSRHIAAIEGEALVARNPGTATITATVGANTATATVNVLAISSLQIVPDTLSIPVGFVDNWIAAFATLSDGSVIEATPSVTWASSTPSMASFGMSGATETNTPLSGVAPGDVTITAKLGAVTGMATVTVTPAVTVESLAITPSTGTLHFDSSQALVATATLSGGTSLDVTPFVTWGAGMSTGGLTFTSDFMPGVLSGFAPAGADTMIAQLGSQMATAALTVSSSAIVSVAVLPQAISLTAGQTQPMTVTATYADGSTADVTTLAMWTSTDDMGAVAVVDQTSTSRATVVAEGTGMATLTAAITPAGPYVGGAVETFATTTVTVQ